MIRFAGRRAIPVPASRLPDRSNSIRLALLLVRGGWRGSDVVSALAATLPLVRRAHFAAALCTAALGLVLATGRAIRRSVYIVRNPPTRNETPRNGDAASPSPSYERFRNPFAAALGAASVELPEPFRGRDLESSDGSFDRRLAAGLPVSVPLAPTRIPPHVASTSRRVAGPSTESAKDIAPDSVWLVPSARYHLKELGPLAEEFTRRGIPGTFVCAATPGLGLRNELARWADDFHLLTDPDLMLDRATPRAVVVLNDWGPHAALVEAAQRRGVPTFAKVEGAQDFANLDTPRRVKPYTRTDYVMCQGQYDLQHIGARGTVVGSARLETLIALADAQLIEPRLHDHVVANFNFSYGNRQYAAKRWLTAAEAACSGTNSTLAISVHPAVKPPESGTLCRFPLALELELAHRFITRSSTALFDALAIGTPVAYFNPHGERCWRDLPFDSRVPEVKTTKHLRQWIQEDTPCDITLGRSWLYERFLSVEAASSAQRMADLVLNVAG